MTAEPRDDPRDVDDPDADRDRAPPDAPRDLPARGNAGTRRFAFVQEAACAERAIVLKIRVPRQERASSSGDGEDEDESGGGETAFLVVGAVPALARACTGTLAPEVRRAIWGGKLPAGFVRQRAREEALAGTHVVGIADDAIVLGRLGESTERVIRIHGGRVVVADRAPDAPTGDPFVGASGALRERWAKRGNAIAEALAKLAADGRRAEVGRAIDRGLTKIERRRQAIGGDLAKIGEADAIAAQAQWLVGEAVRAPRGAKQLVVTDWSTGEPRDLVVPLDPSKSAREQVEAMFKRAKRLRLGAKVAEARLVQATAQHDALGLARLALDEAETLAAIEAVAADAKRAAPRDVTIGGPTTDGAIRRIPRAQAGRTPFRTFLARSGRKLFVGKGGKDNDTLTLHVAKPHDLWLHAKDRVGAHVIVPLDRGTTCAADDLVDAAHLAAHFSDARDDAVVDVQYTPRRYLRKPKGSAPGLVVVEREKVLVLRVESAILRALLEREEAAG